MKTLIVDDEKNILKTVKICLKSAGYDVVTAEDGATAVQLAFDLSPNLILLYLVLPKMNGMLVIQALQDDERTKDIPIVVMSAKAQDEVIEKACTLGAADYLVKPFEPKTLLEMVHRFDSRREALNSETDSNC